MPDKKIRNIILISLIAALLIECVWLLVISPRKVPVGDAGAGNETASGAETAAGTGGSGVKELVFDSTASKAEETGAEKPESGEAQAEAASVQLFSMPDPTPTPVVTTAPYAASMKNVVTPITEKDLEGLTAEELRIKRNEIFARHGLIFGAEDLNAYFSAQPWYEGTVTDSESIELSDVELANIQVILDYEEKMGYNQ
ncbi:MAG: YARHG domain-containing protein [Lachnospiraceae bacterium]|nr:YARHG domain-containing protein [Lachnospiraceae bacterium]